MGGEGYLDEGEFAGALVQVVDDHLSIEIHPPLTSEQVVNARCHLLPAIVVAMPTHTQCHVNTPFQIIIFRHCHTLVVLHW